MKRGLLIGSAVVCVLALLLCVTYAVPGDTPVLTAVDVAVQMIMAGLVYVFLCYTPQILVGIPLVVLLLLTIWGKRRGKLQDSAFVPICVLNAVSLCLLVLLWIFRS